MTSRVPAYVLLLLGIGFADYAARQAEEDQAMVGLIADGKFEAARYGEAKSYTANSKLFSVS
jgi:hypothetical protein